MTRFWDGRTDGQTDGQTDGVTALLDLLSPSAPQVKIQELLMQYLVKTAEGWGSWVSSFWCAASVIMYSICGSLSTGSVRRNDKH